MEIRRIDNNTYDVFSGTQWDKWSRVRQNRNGVYVVAGERLPHPELKELHSVLAPNMPINYGQRLETTLHNCAVVAAAEAARKQRH